MSDAEKVTVNLNVVDLGKMDLLVQEGYYSNRTDFIKTSIRNQISTHSDFVDKVITSSSYGLSFTAGMI